MNKASFKKIADHPDRDEIISKLVIDTPPKTIHAWLAAKYTNVSESKFVLPEKLIQSFKDNYLDIWTMIQEDLSKARVAVNTNAQDDLQLAVNNLPAYKDLVLKTATEELDIRKIIRNLCVAIETRLSQVFDQIQSDPNNINTRVDRLLIEYTEALGNILEKYYKFTEAPVNTMVQHNVTLQVVDQHISVFHDVIRDVLSKMDLETSLYFMDVFNEKMNKLKAPDKEVGTSSEVRLAEAKLLNETINKKIN